MFETKKELFDWLSTQNKFSMKLHLTRVKRACEILGNPQDELKTVHVAGTNGKGSTVNYISRLLVASGFKVGIYISPYIITFNERIQINHEYISDEDLLRCANIILPVIEQVEKELNDEMTEFEIITLLSFVYFKSKKVDYVIFEVGLGGRYDATNVINPLVCGITNISYDHIGVLGNTLTQIAYEKAGIVKENTLLLTTEERETVLQVFEDYCKEVNGKLQICDFDEIKDPQFSDHGMTFNYQRLPLYVPMLGIHQLKNLLLALKIYEYLMKIRKMSIKDEYIYNGLKNAKWGGRLEIIKEKPLVLIDGSHNIDGVNTLVEAMKYYLDKGYKIHTVFAALKDKETDKMLAQLQSISTELTLTSFNYYRAETAKNLYENTNKLNVTYHEDYLTVLNEKLNKIKNEELLLVTGSLYFISKVITYFQSIDKD
ncbi:bifunctional folylpolyglutamate synthase/dihydrofolate synthase [Mycoplasmatota bacterium]|nr:bifunctional folylpolyglutamate synthase/dihydrofolate synthase [Mycoplasmatota bacterium]